MDKWTAADWIGFYGAIVATISIIWQIIWQVFKNRSKLDIRVDPGFFLSHAGEESETVILVETTLIGDKLIGIKAWGCLLEGKNYIQLPNYPTKDIPKELKPGNRSVCVGVPISTIKEEVDSTLITGIYLLDDAGKIWTKKISQKNIIKWLKINRIGWKIVDIAHHPRSYKFLDKRIY